MLITMLAAGSRGDTQPYVALGVKLKEAGYRVRIAASVHFESFVKGFGLEFYPLPGDISKIANHPAVKKAMKSGNPLKMLLIDSDKTLKKTFKSQREGMQEGFYNACKDSDVILYHPGAAIGYFIAQRLNIPGILATPFPMTPTQEYPCLIFHDSIFGGKQFNWLTHLIFEKIMWGNSNTLVKKFWQKKFGTLPPNFSNPFPKQRTEKYLTIVSGSNHVLPQPKDWSENVHNTGYWFLDESSDWNPPVELQNFLDEGEPPVYVGFGSIGDPETAEETTKLVIDALKLSRQRGILVTGWSGMVALDEVPEDILILKSVPHAWLFPKMSAVVHHGGAGTTAATLRAGVPGVVVPHGLDQFAWGKRVYDLGVGAKPIPKKELTAEKLAIAINQALTEEVKYRAKQLGEKIQNENGTQKAIELIVNYLEKS